MSIAFFWFPILLVHSTSSVAPEPVSTAATEFATAVTKRADAGWQLRDLHSSYDSDGLQLSMTLASAKRAERISVRYHSESQSLADSRIALDLGAFVADEDECGC